MLGKRDADVAAGPRGPLTTFLNEFTRTEWEAAAPLRHRKLAVLASFGEWVDAAA